jgi:hypothetical protein
VDEAMHHGPQVIIRDGVEVAVVLSSAAYRKMSASRQTLSRFFRASPLVGMDLDLRRDCSDLREDAATCDTARIPV